MRAQMLEYTSRKATGYSDWNDGGMDMIAQMLEIWNKEWNEHSKYSQFRILEMLVLCWLAGE